MSAPNHAAEGDFAATMLRLFEDWGRGYEPMCQSLHDTFAGDCEWRNPGAPVTVGADQAIALVLQPGHEGPLRIDAIRVDVLKIAQSGSVVFSERIDHLVDVSGTTLASIPVAGVTEFNGDGKIARWAEYADMSALGGGNAVT